MTLPPVPAQTMLLSLCVMGSFIMPATLKIPVFPTWVLWTVVSALVALLDREMVMMSAEGATTGL